MCCCRTYRGLAVTSPFKKRAAAYAQAELPSVNCLIRSDGRWKSAKTDIEGVRIALRRLDVRRREQLSGVTVDESCLWSWPEFVEPPTGLRFRGGEVGVIAYGGRARRIAETIRSLGGRPRYLGAAWFCAQAQAQRQLWEAAR